MGRAGTENSYDDALRSLGSRLRTILPAPRGRGLEIEEHESVLQRQHGAPFPMTTSDSTDQRSQCHWDLALGQSPFAALDSWVSALVRSIPIRVPVVPNRSLVIWSGARGGESDRNEGQRGCGPGLSAGAPLAVGWCVGAAKETKAVTSRVNSALLRKRRIS